ncbi:MAG TPA: nuclear transport factor 2 family protein [Gemmatimonadales bacterium]|nr:nuclear transport factor 2 family protein [Gemmatimonadales bacterium]
MNANARLIETLYEALSRRDASRMAACYHPEVEFSDQVFPRLRGAEVPAMWKMLCERGTDLRIEWNGVEADAESGRAHLEAWYTFGASGRKVHNRIDAEFRFQDGRIIRQRDQFSFWRWSRQALGPPGWLLGWSPALRRRVRAQAAVGLARFLRTGAG